MFDEMAAAISYIFRTRRRLDAAPRGLDEYTRDTAPTRSLLAAADLLRRERDYAVVTGSRGKGSVTAIMAKLLQAQGRRVGTITSPHLVHWNERIRVDGRMIPTERFLGILNDLRPAIDATVASLDAAQYLSPQGIFLAIALRHFDDMDVDAGVLEVGRGGRFDDIAVVPNRLSVFAPIMLEHTALLGGTLERIAWHKAGIIKPGGLAISLPQARAVLGELRRESDAQAADLICIADADIGQWVADRADGQSMRLPAYGELALPLLGRYQIENTTLAIRAVELLAGKSRAPSADYKETIRRGLSDVRWLGRAQQLDAAPAIYVDGAITVRSAESFLASLEPRLRQPVISIVGIPQDRDCAGVYRVMASASQALIITETDINPNTHFPQRETALAAAAGMTDEAFYRADLKGALALARSLAGESGTILLAVSLMLVGECMLIWDVDTTAI